MNESRSLDRYLVHRMNLAIARKQAELDRVRFSKGTLSETPYSIILQRSIDRLKKAIGERERLIKAAS